VTTPLFLQRFLNGILARYRENERLVGWFFFLAGIVWDALTLRRIDNFWDNAILLSYLVVLTFVVVSDILIKANRFEGEWQHKIQPWLTPITQFLLGALLSAIVIYYARSMAWTTQYGVWTILVLSLVANEFLHRHLNTLTTMLIMLCGSSTFIFAWLYPVLASSMNPWLFRLATLSGLVLSLSVLSLAIRLKQSRLHSWGSVQVWSLVLLVALLNFGYQKDWIPPVPMSVSEGGVFQRAQKVGDTYELDYLTTSRIVLFPSYGKTFYYKPGDTVSCFTAIFAPNDMKERVFHVWERYEPNTDTWKATDRIGFELSGGRDTGYRGLTRKQNVSEGKWRVVVKTARGKTLGRIFFKVVPPSEEPVRWIHRVQ
jgi:hypothetical protein